MTTPITQEDRDAAHAIYKLVYDRKPVSSRAKLQELLAAHAQSAVAKREAEIVAWIRKQGDESMDLHRDGYAYIAMRIEDGEHLQTPPQGA